MANDEHTQITAQRFVPSQDKAREVYHRLREPNERGIQKRYHDHANTVSMIGCPRAKQAHSLLDPVLSLLMGAGLKLNRLHVQLREKALG